MAQTQPMTTITMPMPQPLPLQQAQPERRQSVTPKKEKKLSGIYDGEYFNILSRQENTLFVRCNTCGPEALQLRASVKSNGNILKHVKRRHPELLDKIREEKNIKTRGSFTPQNQNTTSYPPPEKKAKIMTFKTEDIVYVDQNPSGTDCMTSSYITTSAPDEKSPFAANVMVHLQPQPMHTHESVSVDHQQHHVITSQNISEHIDHTQTEVEDEDEEEDDNHEEDGGQEECDNIEYQEASLSDMESSHQIQHSQQHVRNDVHHRSIVGSTSNSAIGHPLTINRSGLTVKRRIEIPHIDDDDVYEEPDPLDHHQQPDDHTIVPQFFGAQPSKYPSINRGVDHDREIVALRKKLMMREFEMVQQKHRLEIEILQKELEFKKIHHQKTIECLNKQLRQK